MSTRKEPTGMIGNSIETDAALILAEEHRSIGLQKDRRERQVLMMFQLFEG